jgi:hypothetical protein
MLIEACTASLHGENGEVGYIVGDANGDGQFDQLDIQSVLQAGKYATGQPADWSEGDWTGDELFDQRDLILALQSWPDLIPLPHGFEAEGIEVGHGQDFFVGGNSWSGYLSYAGAVYKGNLCTGEGRLLVEATGKPIAGLSYDARTDHLYAAAGFSEGFSGPRWEQGVNVYDASTGEVVAEFIFPSSNEGDEDGTNMVINDVLVTDRNVYATDSVNEVLYRIPLADDGELTLAPAVEILRMTGFAMVPDEFNANGLAGDFGGNQLVVVNITSGALYRVDTETGAASAIAIEGEEQLFIDGDGLFMEDRTLYIMQNFSQKIAVVQLSDDLSQGTFIKNLLSDDFAIPTTITGLRHSIYAINTDFCIRTSFCGVENPDTTKVQSDVVRVDK